MNRSLGLLLIATAVVASASSAEAQRITSPYQFIATSQEAGVFVAAMKTARGSVGLGADDGLAFGARYSIRLSGPFSIEAEGLYFPTERAIRDTVVVDSAFRSIGTAKQTLGVFGATLRLDLTGMRTWHHIRPFVALGGGVAMGLKDDHGEVEVTPVDAKLDFGTSFAGILGAGFELFPTERLSIRVDGRNYLWKLETPAALTRGSLGVTMPPDEWLQNVGLEVGLSLHF